jgi:hypothetical protein
MSAWVEPVGELADRAAVVECPEGQIAWQELLAAIASVSGSTREKVEGGAEGLSFLVVGCHTEPSW